MFVWLASLALAVFSDAVQNPRYSSVEQRIIEKILTWLHSFPPSSLPDTFWVGLDGILETGNGLALIDWVGQHLDRSSHPVIAQFEQDLRLDAARVSCWTALLEKGPQAFSLTTADQLALSRMMAEETWPPWADWNSVIGLLIPEPSYLQFRALFVDGTDLQEFINLYWRAFGTSANFDISDALEATFYEPDDLDEAEEDLRQAVVDAYEHWSSYAEFAYLAQEINKHPLSDTLWEIWNAGIAMGDAINIIQTLRAYEENYVDEHGWPDPEAPSFVTEAPVRVDTNRYQVSLHLVVDGLEQAEARFKDLTGRLLLPQPLDRQDEQDEQDDEEDDEEDLSRQDAIATIHDYYSALEPHEIRVDQARTEDLVFLANLLLADTTPGAPYVHPDRIRRAEADIIVPDDAWDDDE